MCRQPQWQGEEMRMGPRMRGKGNPECVRGGRGDGCASESPQSKGGKPGGNRGGGAIYISAKRGQFSGGKVAR